MTRGVRLEWYTGNTENPAQATSGEKRAGKQLIVIMYSTNLVRLPSIPEAPSLENSIC